MTKRYSMDFLASIFDRRAILAIISGVLIAVSFPNAGLSFTAWIALIPLLIALEGSNRKESLRVGFLCGFSAYSIILYWITIVMTRYGHLPWGVSIPLYFILVMWLSLFYAGATYITRIAETLRIKSAFTLPVAWVALDFARGWLFTGFPWAMLGHSQYRILPLVQIADIFGVYGITALIVLSNVVLYRVLRAVFGATVPYPVKSALILLALLVSTLAYGFYRLNPQTAEHQADPVRIALIQGNIPQDVKWSPEFRDKAMGVHTRISRDAAKEPLDLIVWPESAVPFFFQDDPQQATLIQNLTRELSTSILFGSPAYEIRNGKRTFLNSAYMINQNGETMGRADKLHLVPYGEYVPLGRFFPFINKIVTGIGDFAPGERANTLPVKNSLIATQICYEIIFPELVRQYVNAGARIIVNITNDAWFGKSSAPYQHLSIAAFRTIETRTPLVRAANTGITAFIDQNGHIKTMTSLFTEEYRVVTVTPGNAKSIYLKTGDIAPWFCIAISVGILLYSRKQLPTTGNSAQTITPNAQLNSTKRAQKQATS